MGITSVINGPGVIPINIDRARLIWGWMSLNELRWLAHTAKEADEIFEIGSYQGKSTRVLADNTFGRVHAIDGWNTCNYAALGRDILFKTDEVIFNQFYCNLSDHIESGKVVVPGLNWEDYYPPNNADFIFIDGDHRYESVKRDISKALKYATPEAIISGHDYNWIGVERAVNEYFNINRITWVDTIWAVQLGG